jgi:hypothetical protein
MNEIKMGKKLSCGAYDPYYVVREIRSLIFKRYNKPVPGEFLDEIFEIIKEGE